MLLASANRRNPWILPSNLCRRLLTVSPQGIRFFSVRSIITNVEVLFVHSKINYAVDQNTNQAPDNGVPPDDEKCSAGLVPHLLEANFCFPFKDAVHYARTVGLVGVHHSEKVGSAKEAREESPPRGRLLRACGRPPTCRRRFGRRPIFCATSSSCIKVLSQTLLPLLVLPMAPRSLLDHVHIIGGMLQNCLFLLS
ncbi:hypothetical protein ACFX2B_018052 [Malus domestica]